MGGAYGTMGERRYAYRALVRKRGHLEGQYENRNSRSVKGGEIRLD